MSRAWGAFVAAVRHATERPGPETDQEVLKAYDDLLFQDPVKLLRVLAGIDDASKAFGGNIVVRLQWCQTRAGKMFWKNSGTIKAPQTQRVSEGP